MLAGSNSQSVRSVLRTIGASPHFRPLQPAMEQQLSIEWYDFMLRGIISLIIGDSQPYSSPMSRTAVLTVFDTEAASEGAFDDFEPVGIFAVRNPATLQISPQSGTGIWELSIL